MALNLHKDSFNFMRSTMIKGTSLPKYSLILIPKGRRYSIGNDRTRNVETSDKLEDNNNYFSATLDAKPYDNKIKFQSLVYDNKSNGSVEEISNKNRKSKLAGKLQWLIKQSKQEEA
jgi:hypothetical protein